MRVALFLGQFGRNVRSFFRYLSLLSLQGRKDSDEIPSKLRVRHKESEDANLLRLDVTQTLELRGGGCNHQGNHGSR